MLASLQIRAATVRCDDAAVAILPQKGHADAATDEEIISRFPVGYYPLHPNVSLNFQMNRFYGWVGEEKMLDEMRAAAPRISSYDDWTRRC